MKHNIAVAVAMNIAIGLTAPIASCAAEYRAVPINNLTVPLNTRCVNDKGQVVGAMMINKDHHVYYRAALWDSVNGTVALDGLGGPNSGGFSINNSGVVAGWSDSTVIDPETKRPIRHACIWYPGKKPVDLSPKKSLKSSEAVLISDSGVIAGTYDDLPAVFQVGKPPVILPVPESFQGISYRYTLRHISSDGKVLGWGIHDKRINLLEGPPQAHILRWTPDDKSVDDFGDAPHAILWGMLGGGRQNIFDENGGFSAKRDIDINGSLVVVGFRHHDSDRDYLAGYDPLLPGATQAEISPQPVFWRVDMLVDAILNYPKFSKLNWHREPNQLEDFRPDLYIQSAAINDAGMIVMPVPDHAMPIPPPPSVPPEVEKLRKQGKEVYVEVRLPTIVRGTLYLWPKAGSAPIDLSEQTGVWLTSVFGISDHGAIVAGGAEYTWAAKKQGSSTVMENDIPYLLMPAGNSDSVQPQNMDGAVEDLPAVGTAPVEAR